jgi:hypothetical protein
LETSLRIPYGIRRALQREFLTITVHSDSPGVLFYRDRSHATRQAR